MKEDSLAGIWAERGTDDPPLLWTVKYWPAAQAEAKMLTPPQYWHVADQLKEMARTKDCCACPTVDIAKISSFWELKDKGGPLGKINLRVFFIVDAERHSIVVLGIHKKEDEDQLRRSVIVRIERRERLYLESIAPKRS